MTTHTFLAFILDHLEIVLDALQLLITIGAGVACFFLIRPADKKLQQLQSDLQRQTDAVNSVRTAIMDAGVEHQIEHHRTLIKEHLLVFRAFQKVYSSSGILQWGEALKDLGEIKRNNRPSPGLKAFSDAISQFLSDNWMQDSVFQEAAEAELFVSDRIWKLFIFGKTLLSLFQIQLRELGLNSEQSFVKKDEVKRTLSQLFPNDLELFDRFGTAYYYTLITKIRFELIKEIKSVIAQTPLNSKPLSELNIMAERIAFEQENRDFPAVPDFAKRESKVPPRTTT